MIPGGAFFSRLRAARVAREIRPHFGAGFYRARYGRLVGEGVDPVRHYVAAGAKQGLDPAGFFSTNFYLRAYPDVVASGMNPFLHYFRYGRAEGRFASEAEAIASGFDAEFYLARYPDVARSGADPLHHFMTVGSTENRNPNREFSTREYAESVPLTQRRGLKAFAHYIIEGKWTGLTPKPDIMDEIRPYFDERFYSARYRDAIVEGVDPVLHYATLGARQGRDPTAAFSTSFYLRVYPDVAASGMNPFLHYLRHGRAEGRFGSEREAIASAFDPEFYVLRYPDVARSGVDPLEHFITTGAAEQRDPHPGFSTREYVENVPAAQRKGLRAFAHYVVEGRRNGLAPRRNSAKNPAFRRVFDAAGVDPESAERAIRARERDVIERLANGALGEMVASATMLEPLVMHPARHLGGLALTPYGTAATELSATLLDMHEAAGTRRAEAVVVIPHCRMSGAARVAGDLAHALAELHGPEEVVVIRTDLSNFEHPEWFPSGCRQIDFAAAVEANGAKRPFDRQHLLFTLIRSLAPRRVFNVNSNLFWHMTRRHGAALKDCADVFAYVFCTERNASGAEGGYPIQFFADCFDLLDGMIADSGDLAETLRERFMIPPAEGARIGALATPLRERRLLAPQPPLLDGRRPQVFWAGRFDPQKRLDIVFEIARRMPDADFLVWGQPVLNKAFAPVDVPGNLTFQGVYDDFADLPLGRCDAWLYTAEWDGVPTILLDIAASGVPLVASLVGGTGEVLVDELCHRVRQVEDVAAFETGLRAVFADPQTARGNAARMRDRVIETRTPERYRTALESFLAGAKR